MSPTSSQSSPDRPLRPADAPEAAAAQASPPPAAAGAAAAAASSSSSSAPRRSSANPRSSPLMTPLSRLPGAGAASPPQHTLSAAGSPPRPANSGAAGVSRKRSQHRSAAAGVKAADGVSASAPGSRRPPSRGATTSSHPGSPPYPPHSGYYSSHTSRHPSMGSVTTRPVAPLSNDQRTAFEEAVASSALASTSSGLQALLRDHPELVSSELAKAAGQEWSQLNESARGSRPGTDPPTPLAEDDEAGRGDVFWDDGVVTPEIGEGGHGGVLEKANNLGAAGESKSGLAQSNTPSDTPSSLSPEREWAWVYALAARSFRPLLIVVVVAVRSAFLVVVAVLGLALRWSLAWLGLSTGKGRRRAAKTGAATKGASEQRRCWISRPPFPISPIPPKSILLTINLSLLTSSSSTPLNTTRPQCLLPHHLPPSPRYPHHATMAPRPLLPPHHPSLAPRLAPP